VDPAGAGFKVRAEQGVGTSRLPGLDPAAEQLVDELAEAAARVVDLLRLLVATGEECFVERDGKLRRGRNQAGNPLLGSFQVTDEVDVGVVGDEASRRERRLD